MTFINKVAMLQEKLKRNKRTQLNLKFPEQLDTDGHAGIMRFNINLPSGSKYIPNGDYKKVINPKTDEPVSSIYRQIKSGSTIADNFSGNYIRIATSIDLYMPNQIQTSYQSDWGQDNLGAIGSLADAGMGLNVNNWEDAAKAWEVAKNSMKESVSSTAASAVQTISPFNLETLRASATSTVSNPYMEVLFNGVQNRTFSFTFKMIPNNQREQVAIKKIIEEFKFHRAPEFKYSDLSNYMLFPSEFDIQFLNNQGENPWLFKISTCALTNLTINYTPDGQYATRKDGSPFATEMTLEFTELTTLTKESHRMGY